MKNLIKLGKLEKNPQLWLGLLILLLAIIYIFTSLGRIDLIKWIAFITGILLALFLYTQGGVFEYIRRKEFRKISISDFVVWLTFITATAVLINSLVIFQSIKNIAPEWLIRAVASTGITIGIVASILAVIYIFTERPK